MPVWNLEPGAEGPATPGRPKRTGNITPTEVASRAEASGARVELVSGRYRVYPPDRSQSPIFFGERFDNGRARLNVIAALRRAGVDVATHEVAEDPAQLRADEDQKRVQAVWMTFCRLGKPGQAVKRRDVHQKLRDRDWVTSPASLTGPIKALIDSGLLRPVPHLPGQPGRPSERYLVATNDMENETVSTSRATPSADHEASALDLADLKQQVQAMLEMLAEAETRDRQRQGEIALLNGRLDEVESRLAETPGAPAPRNPHAELDEAITAFVRATPIKLTAGVIAANIDGSHAPELVEERLVVLADLGVVKSDSGVYLTIPSDASKAKTRRAA